MTGGLVQNSVEFLLALLFFPHTRVQKLYKVDVNNSLFHKKVDEIEANS